MKIDLKPNEVVTKVSDTKFLNGKSVSGKLILTNQRLYFKALENGDHAYNLEIMPVEIQEVMPFKTGFFTNDGMNIITKNGRELKFKIKQRSSWEASINRIY